MPVQRLCSCVLSTIFQYLDTATQFLLGESIGSLSGKEPAHAEGFLDAFADGFSGSGMRIAIGPFKIFLSKSRWLESCRKTHRFTDYYIDKALQYRRELLAGKTESASHVLLYNMAKETGDRVELRNQIIQALMAAQETTANLLGNVFYLLARYPKVWEKLREEVLLIEQKPLDFDQLMKMKYLRNVLNESTYCELSYVQA